MYGKLVDGNLVKAPKKINVGDVDIYNPTNDVLVENGYKEVIDTPYPEIDEDIETPVSYKNHWEEQIDKIIKVWTESIGDETEPKIIDFDDIIEDVVEDNEETLDRH